MTRQTTTLAPLPARDAAVVLDATQALWDEMRGRCLFITGGSGFIGSWLVETCLAANDRFGLGAKVVMLTRDLRGYEARMPHLAGHRALELVEGDVRSFRFPAGTFPFVIHAATAASAVLNDAQPLEMFDTIVSGTRRVLEFASVAGARRLLFTSSGAVYGPQPPEVERIAEDFGGGPSPESARSAYAEGKRAAETMCAAFAHGGRALEPLLARCFAFVGPHLPLDAHFAIGNFIGDALEGRAIRVRGDGTPLRSYLYAADLAIWLWTILFRGLPLRPYNVGSERAHSIAEIAGATARAVDPPLSVTIAGVPSEGRLPERYVPDTGRARTELELAEATGLEEGIARTIAWHRGR
jgi:dTDP-glucose 4,6-dehydratase